MCFVMQQHHNDNGSDYDFLEKENEQNKTKKGHHTRKDTYMFVVSNLNINKNSIADKTVE